MKQISRFQSDDRAITQLQSNILEIINPILRQNPILFGNTINEYQLSSGNNSVPTGLNQQLQGWIIIRKFGNANIYEVSSNNNTLVLNSDASVLISLIVF